MFEIVDFDNTGDSESNVVISVHFRRRLLPSEPYARKATLEDLGRLAPILIDAFAKICLFVFKLINSRSTSPIGSAVTRQFAQAVDVSVSAFDEDNNLVDFEVVDATEPENTQTDLAVVDKSPDAFKDFLEELRPELDKLGDDDEEK